MILPFELDPQIIHHIIHSQAGSIGKAIIELIMNSIDAGAKIIRLNMSQEGFTCEDDGIGFVSKDDVVNYFGRFGTPHQEGDATYGRFRLGRGQIMAHASTTWNSNAHQMIVDTLKMGYNYDFTSADDHKPGCYIKGIWYEELTKVELLSTLQEIRDLIRYTQVSVEMNGKLITRDPKAEEWDFEDEYAYYRVKLEGAVSIYNQGVLVRHDAAHIWGAGGLIVSKKALALNVSRTEVLRKTCSVWKQVAKKFSTLASEISDYLNDRRKTEARREKSVRCLLSGEGDLNHIARAEEIITILPGNRHITLMEYYRMLTYQYKMNLCMIENDHDIPKAELMSKVKIALFIHPKTLRRFGVYSPDQFLECLNLITDNIDFEYFEYRDRKLLSNVVKLIDFKLLSKEFKQHMEILQEKKSLDKETRRAWAALRWCLQHYAGACLGKQIDSDGRVAYDEDTYAILLGQSNTAEAWTDGASYVAFNIDIVKKLKTDPIKTAARIFTILEHEIAHEGDSVDAGHDELFYQRYHDISINMSSERQRYMHMWLMKYTISLEREKNQISGRAWSERFLIDRAGNGRKKKGLGQAIEDLSNNTIVRTHIPDENVKLITELNMGLSLKGLRPNTPNWEEILTHSEYISRSEEYNPQNVVEDYIEVLEEYEMEEHLKIMEEFRGRVSVIVGVDGNQISDDTLDMMYYEGISDEEILELWNDKEWQGWQSNEPEDYIEEEEEQNPLLVLDKEYHQYIESGETIWSLKRNAAASGFFDIEDYLNWRANI